MCFIPRMPGEFKEINTNTEIFQETLAWIRKEAEEFEEIGKRISEEANQKTQPKKS